MAVVRKKGDWLVANIGGESILMSRQRTRHIGLDEIGARIWEMMDTSVDIDTICARLRQEYAVTPEECRAQVENFLSELSGHDAVQLGASQNDS